MMRGDLINFEKEVIDLFNDGKLKSPVHLSGGNEDQLVEIFKEIRDDDWVFSTYRSHYHALLHGIDRTWLLNWVKDNKSIHVMNKDKPFFTSAIVGGCIPIALGVAMALKMKNSRRRVYCFVGDMTAETGGFWEAYKYSLNHNLPIVWIIEDNGLSTDTNTKEVWGEKTNWRFEQIKSSQLKYYEYTRTFPHYGTGKFISKLWEKEDVKSKGF